MCGVRTGGGIISQVTSAEPVGAIDGKGEDGACCICPVPSCGWMKCRQCLLQFTSQRRPGFLLHFLKQKVLAIAFMDKRQVAITGYSKHDMLTCPVAPELQCTVISCHFY